MPPCQSLVQVSEEMVPAPRSVQRPQQVQAGGCEESRLTRAYPNPARRQQRHDKLRVTGGSSVRNQRRGVFSRERQTRATQQVSIGNFERRAEMENLKRRQHSGPWKLPRRPQALEGRRRAFPLVLARREAGWPRGWGRGTTTPTCVLTLAFTRGVLPVLP